MQPIQLLGPASGSYTYLVFDEATRDAVIIDPVDDQLGRDGGQCQGGRQDAGRIRGNHG